MASYIPYPDIENKNFFEKIYKKKEFYDTKPSALPDPSNQSEELLKSLYPARGDFKLLPVQVFLKNFISEVTPYKGVLIWHGTGTGKTCSSIVISERFRKRVLETGKKILLIVNPNIQNEFFKTIFNFEKENTKKSIRQIVQCTGRTYSLGEESKYLSTKKKQSQIMKMIKEIYEITGRDSLRNNLLKETGWDGNDETITNEIKGKIKEIYSNRVIVVDEVHNRVGTSEKDKSIPTILNAIVSNADNIRLILMSATPMVNSPEDIMFPINLLRLNDRRPQIKVRSVFKSDGNFTPGGEKLLKEMAKGYISYVRGGDPPRFPYKIIPPESKVPKPKFFFNGTKIPESEKIKFTRVIKCEMQNYQYRTYKASLKTELKSKIGGLLPGTTQAGDIVFPTLPDNKYGAYGSYGYGDPKSDDRALIETKDSRGNQIYQYASFSEGFLLRKNIIKYSTKMASIFDNMISSVGISFIYSEYVSSGVLAIALMLEENGFEPAIVTGKEQPKLRSKTKKPPICYKCGKSKHSPTDHEWSPAKYVLLTGSTDLPKSDVAKISAYINREDNMYGKLAKVLLGSRVAGEGIDFKRIRQVHILEPWYNQAKIDQIEGRAIRNGSHRDLPPEERNVEVFKYCIIPPKIKDDGIETIDEHDYRISEDKDKKIKKVAYILKQIAIDCMFQRENNIRNIKRTIKLEDSRGRIINYVTGDKPYSRECDYKKSCSYKCQWEPKSLKSKKKIVINRSTYTSDFADFDIEKSREIITKLFIKNPIIDITSILSNIKIKYPNIDDIYIYLALESLMKKDSLYSIQDKYGREGYLVEKGDLYIYQPFELLNKNAPLIYKTTPLKTKPEEVVLKEENVFAFGKEEKIKINAKKVLENIEKYIKNIIIALKYYKVNPDDFQDIITDMVFFMIPVPETFALLKYLENPLEKEAKSSSLSKNLLELKKKAIKYYEKNKNIRRGKFLSVMVNKNYCAQWGKGKLGIKRKKNIEKWGRCDPGIEALMETEIDDNEYSKLWFKFPENKRVLQNTQNTKITKREYINIMRKNNLRPLILGTVESKILDGSKYLKLFDFRKLGDFELKSKRKEIRGRVCSSLKVNVLKEITIFLENEVSKLKIKNISIPKIKSTKIFRPRTCIKLEFLLRLLNQKDRNKIWFYEGSLPEI